jgi:polyhydroxyalkanoate synthesis regulator phasin
MFDLIKKAMFTGIGMAALTKEKIEEIAADFVQKGNLSENEGRKLVDEMMKKSEESKEEIKKQLDALVYATIEKMQLARTSQIDEISQALQILKEKIESVENQLAEKKD